MNVCVLYKVKKKLVASMHSALQKTAIAAHEHKNTYFSFFFYNLIGGFFRLAIGGGFLINLSFALSIVDLKCFFLLSIVLFKCSFIIYIGK